MRQSRKLGLVANLILCFVLQTLGADKYTDENRPYEFGFKIDGQQHRHESKDENGIIMGEFGFVTADDVYHVTVYATDKEGRFKILSMKNIHLKSNSAPTSARQGHSLPLPPEPPASVQVSTPIRQNGVSSLGPLPPQAGPVSQGPQPQPAKPHKPISIEPPRGSCSSCSLPTTTTRAPPPAYNQVTSNNNYNSPNQIGAPKLPPQSQPAYHFGPQNNPSGPQNNLSGPQSYPSVPQNNPSSPQYNPSGPQNYPSGPQNNPSGPQNNPSSPQYNPSGPQNYPSGPQNNPSGPQNNPSSPQYNPSGPQNNPFSPQNYPAGPQNYPSGPQNNPSGPQNYPSGPKVPQREIVAPNSNIIPYAPNNAQDRPRPGVDQQTYTSRPQNIPQGPFTPQSDQIPQNYPSSPSYTGSNNNPYTGAGPSVPAELSRPNKPEIPRKISDTPGGVGERTAKQYRPDPQDPRTNTKPMLVTAQMQIVDKNTDIYALGPNEQRGLPPGLSQGDMTQLLYTFNYTVGFHGHFEEGYANGVKKGYYFVTGRNGVRTRIDYVADDTGFHPKVSQEVLDLLSEDVPKPETEKDEKYGLKGYEFKWLYYPVETK